MAKKKAAKKKTAKRSTKKTKNLEALYVASKVKAAIKEHDMNVAGDALEGLNNVIYWNLQQAADRAKLNGRKTVRSHDFVV